MSGGVCEDCGKDASLLWCWDKSPPRFCGSCVDRRTGQGEHANTIPAPMSVPVPSVPEVVARSARNFLPTWSALERAYHCPTSFALPQTRTTSAAAKQGTKNHTAKEKAVDTGDLDGIPQTAAEFLRESGSDKHETEVAYALNVKTRTVRRLGTKIERDYSDAKPWEIVGTIDVISGARVLDYKSRARVTEAKDNFQIRAAALARAEEVGGVSEMRGALSYLDDGELDAATFDAFDLAGFWDTLESIASRVIAATYKGELSEGDWCKYCPAFTSCSAKTTLARALVPELAALDAQVTQEGDRFIANMTPEQAGQAWEKLKQIKRIAERVEDAIKDLASETTIPLASGKVLVMVQREQVRVDLKKAREMFGNDLPTNTVRFQKVEEKKGTAA